jgi:hypothetical protein
VRPKSFGTLRSRMKMDMVSQVVFELCMPTKSPIGLASLVSCYWFPTTQLYLFCYLCQMVPDLGTFTTVISA